MKIADIINEAFDVLKRGGIILYPTDTIWGIGCDACNEEAVRKVTALKKRSEEKSLAVLASDLDMVARYINKIPSIAVDLVEVNDSPMTIIYPDAIVANEKGGASFGLAPSVVAEDGSVGIRIPIVSSFEKNDCKRRKTATTEFEAKNISAGAIFCNKLIYKLRRPLVSTSANISGEPAPSRFGEISKEILEGVDYVVPESFVVEEKSEAEVRKGQGEGGAKGGRKLHFDDSATGKSSQIIKLGVNGEVKVIRF